MEKVKILNAEIDNYSLNELLENVKEGIFVNPNVDCLMQLQKDRELYNIYENSDYVICDSQIIKIISRLLGRTIKERIAGSDFFPEFYKYHKNNKNIKIFLFGGMDGVATKAMRKINHKVGRNIIVGAYSPPMGFYNYIKENEKAVNIINKTDANVLAVCLGSPIQEKWIFNNKQKLKKIKLYLSLGATVDFEAGVIKKAPNWISRIGLEWLYRLLQEPRRLYKRYLLNDLPFFYLILKQKIGNYNNPF